MHVLERLYARYYSLLPELLLPPTTPKPPRWKSLLSRAKKMAPPILTLIRVIDLAANWIHDWLG